MYTAHRIDNSYHVSRDGHGKMRSNSKIGIIRLIMTNILAWRDIAEKGFVTVTSYTSGRYVELKITRANGQLVIVDGFTAKED